MRRKIFRESTWISQSRTVLKQYRYYLLLLSLLLLYFIFFSNLWSVRYLVISDSSITDTQQLENSIWDQLQGAKLGIFKKNNYWLIDTEKMTNIAQTQYPYLKVEIQKQYPRTLSLNITIKNSKVVWFQNNIYYLVDNSGQLIHELKSTSINKENYTIFDDRTARNLVLGNNVLRSEDLTKILDIVHIYQSLGLSQLPLNRVILDDISLQTIKLLTTNNVEIHLSYLKDINQQLQKLKTVMNQKGIDLANLQYINLKVDQQVIYR